MINRFVQFEPRVALVRSLASRGSPALNLSTRAIVDGEALVVVFRFKLRSQTSVYYFSRLEYRSEHVEIDNPHSVGREASRVSLV